MLGVLSAQRCGNSSKLTENEAPLSFQRWLTKRKRRVGRDTHSRAYAAARAWQDTKDRMASELYTSLEWNSVLFHEAFCIEAVNLS